MWDSTLRILNPGTECHYDDVGYVRVIDQNEICYLCFNVDRADEFITEFKHTKIETESESESHWLLSGDEITVAMLKYG